jgi:hypothetical protein
MANVAKNGPGEHEMQVYAIGPEVSEALLALAACHGRTEPPTGELRAEAEKLARLVTGVAVGGRRAPSAAEARRAARELHERLRASGAPARVEPQGGPAALSDAVMAAVDFPLREAGVEFWDAACFVGWRGKEPVLLWHLLSPASIRIRLMEPLMARAEQVAQTDELFSVERTASRWWFERWSMPPRLRGTLFAWGVREQEWSLVTRPLLKPDLPVMGLVDTMGVAGKVPPRQAALARAFASSEVGLFEVVERRGEHAVLAEVLSGKRYRVTEHSDETDYRPGFFGMGRVIPFQDGWLRSPGMIFVKIPQAQARQMARGLEEHRGELDREIALEAMIALMLHAPRPPRVVLPGPGVAEARELLTTIHELLGARGFVRQVPAGEMRDMAHAPLPAGQILLELDVDGVLGEWIAALGQQAKLKHIGGGKMARKASRARKRRR